MKCIRHILVSHVGHLAALVWTRLILGRFCVALLPDSKAPAGLIPFPQNLFVGDIVVDVF